MTLYQLSLIAVLAPLAGCLFAGFFAARLPKQLSAFATILGVAVSAGASMQIFNLLHNGAAALNQDLYTWANIGTAKLAVGFLVDRMTAVMMCVVTIVSLMVHIYTMGYMKDDPGYRRFFSYISLFTFSMLMLVMSNNFLQLFFGWEAVGVVSYLLIGFWYTKPSAIFANMKAFLVNRVGDFGFLLGIAVLFMATGAFDYQSVFAASGSLAGKSYSLAGWDVQLHTLACLLLFVGAMGKSAQVPLHVWLPDSMEGPTPISALIHAATMVTAGVFMVARMSPLFEYSEVALNFVLSIGAITCFFTGLMGIVQHDIKRVVAYSTLSQLGYMMTAMGVSAYSIGLFHLVTHAFFKALLFLGAGAVIIALHHQQDMRRMGGLFTKLPHTWACMTVGTLALVGFPFFAGFYSKDLIIMSVAASKLPAAEWASLAVTAGVFVTSLYSFRLLFLVFFKEPRADKQTMSHAHEPGIAVWLPLLLLAIPSVVAGYLMVDPVMNGYLAESLFVLPQHNVVGQIEYHGAYELAMHGFTSLPFALVVLGFVVAFICYMLAPKLPAFCAKVFAWPYRLLVNKYGFDKFNESVLAPFTRGTGQVLWRLGDKALIDGALVNGSAYLVGRVGALARKLQTGMLYHYAFVMILAIFIFMLGVLAPVLQVK